MKQPGKHEEKQMQQFLRFYVLAFGAADSQSCTWHNDMVRLRYTSGSTIVLDDNFNMYDLV